MGIPPAIQQYHSIYPLEGAPAAGEAPAFGIRSQVLKGICSRTGAPAALRRLSPQQVPHPACRRITCDTPCPPLLRTAVRRPPSLKQCGETSASCHLSSNQTDSGSSVCGPWCHPPAEALTPATFAQLVPTGDMLAAAQEAAEAWSAVAQQPNLIALRSAFVSSEVEGAPALFLLHDLHPGAVRPHPGVTPCTMPHAWRPPHCLTAPLVCAVCTAPVGSRGAAGLIRTTRLRCRQALWQRADQKQRPVDRGAALALGAGS